MLPKCRASCFLRTLRKASIKTHKFINAFTVNIRTTAKCTHAPVPFPSFPKEEMLCFYWADLPPQIN